MARLANNSVLEGQTLPLSMAALDDALRAVEPNALLVAPRILRRVIKQHAHVSGLGLRVPHRKTYVIDRDALLAIVDRDELDSSTDQELPARLILLARPSGEAQTELAPAEMLLKYWRLLFHARVHAALDDAVAEGRLGGFEIRSRIEQLGRTEFDEIRAVLKQEEFLLAPKDDRAVYLEFVAVYLELRYFVPSFLRSYFPSLENFHRVDELLRQDLDSEAILLATRLPGAPQPDILPDVPTSERVVERFDAPQPSPRPSRVPARRRSDRAAERMLGRADHRAELGNRVRAAILRTRAARLATPELSVAARELGRHDLTLLVRRLQAALNFTDNESEEWTRSLHALLDQAASGIWAVEARILYDLQKVCVDHERGVYQLDVAGWLFSFGRRPLKRFLPGQRDVLMSKHLRSAARRLPAARLSHRARNRLAALVQAAVHRAEGNLRARFKPLIDRALDRVKLLPANPPERVARKKLVDEILDRIVERGFLSMGDFRDALSRNSLKLPDLASAGQFFSGDELLQADRQLAASLDGVYRGGEIYLRFPQRLSSLAFGTPLGRFLTRYVAIPFGGAFLVLEGLQHLINPLVHAFYSEHYEIVLKTWPRVFLLGLFLLGLLHYRKFRHWCLEAMMTAGRAARRVFVDLPAWLLAMPWVKAIVASLPFRMFRRYAWKPLVLTLLAALVVGFTTDSAKDVWQSSLWVFLGAILLLNSRIGRNMDELLTDWTVQTWHRIRIHVFSTLFRFIMDVFNRLLEGIERLLYTVDEWLRFRAGERPGATAVKAVLAFVWFFVNYVIRFCVNLLIEPQVNPIKHFPVVTVSHKVLLPLTPALTNALTGPLGRESAIFVGTTAILVTPGAFGFLVWELKENWRLYAANRPHHLQPVSIGHHGETMIQFLRPGFRSGTIPKLYARLRKANRKAYWTRNWKASSKYLTQLHHAGETIRRFVDRELLELLHESRTWADRTITTGEIRLGCNRIAIELYCPSLSEDSLWLAFEEEAGWLVASVHRRGWIDHLSAAQRHTLATALAGFYKMAGVDLVREQIESQLPAGAPGYEITDQDLVVWTTRQSEPRVYRLRDWPSMQDTSVAEEVDRHRWVFRATPISWRRWVITWELDHLGGGAKHHLFDDWAILPG